AASCPLRSAPTRRSSDLGIDAFREELPAALDGGVTPVMAKEVIYQAVDYLGMGRVLPFLRAANVILEVRGISLPLEGQATTTLEDRKSTRLNSSHVATAY